MNYHDDLIPIGTWIQMNVPGFPTFIGFTYVDSQAGPSQKGVPRDDPNLAEKPGMTVRLPMPGSAWIALDEGEISRLRLPELPSWVQFYGPQPKRGTQWGTSR